MATLTITITDEMLASIEALAADGMLAIEVEAAVLIGEGIKRQKDRAKANERQRRHDAAKRQPDVRVTSPDVSSRQGDGETLPPEGSPFPFPNPSQSHSYAPPPARSHDAGTREELALDPESLPGGNPSPVAAPPSPRRPQPAPKPGRDKYTPAFEAWWLLRKWGGPKGEAFTAWKAAGLERDEDLREKVMTAVTAQIANKAAVEAAGGFTAHFQDGCRWLKNARWEDNLEPLPPPSTVGSPLPGHGPFRPATPTGRRPQAPSFQEVGQAWLEQRRKAGLT